MNLGMVGDKAGELGGEILKLTDDQLARVASTDWTNLESLIGL
jgi:hypothetical protein